MPKEMRDALQQNIRSENGAQDDEVQSPKLPSTRSIRSSSVIDSDRHEAGSTDSTTVTSYLSKKEDEVRDAKIECKEEVTQLYKSSAR